MTMYSDDYTTYAGLDTISLAEPDSHMKSGRESGDTRIFLRAIIDRKQVTV